MYTCCSIHSLDALNLKPLKLDTCARRSGAGATAGELEGELFAWHIKAQPVQRGLKRCRVLPPQGGKKTQKSSAQQPIRSHSEVLGALSDTHGYSGERLLDLRGGEALERELVVHATQPPRFLLPRLSAGRRAVRGRRGGGGCGGGVEEQAAEATLVLRRDLEARRCGGGG